MKVFVCATGVAYSSGADPAVSGGGVSDRPPAARVKEASSTTFKCRFNAVHSIMATIVVTHTRIVIDTGCRVSPTAIGAPMAIVKPRLAMDIPKMGIENSDGSEGVVESAYGDSIFSAVNDDGAECVTDGNWG